MKWMSLPHPLLPGENAFLKGTLQRQGGSFRIVCLGASLALAPEESVEPGLLLESPGVCQPL